MLITIAAMAAITSRQARSYLNRWKLVHEVEVQELRNASLDIKARQLAALMASRDLFKADLEREKEANVLRERWALIRGADRD